MVKLLDEKLAAFLKLRVIVMLPLAIVCAPDVIAITLVVGATKLIL
jgi:hypothetical protein